MDDKYVRQPDNPGAVLNVDRGGLSAYKKRKAAIQQQEDRLQKMEYQIGEIKDLMAQLIQRVGNNK